MYKIQAITTNCIRQSPNGNEQYSHSHRFEYSERDVYVPLNEI